MILFARVRRRGSARKGGDWKWQVRMRWLSWQPGGLAYAADAALTWHSITGLLSRTPTSAPPPPSLPTAAIGHFSSPAPLLRCVSPAARLLEKSHLWFTGSFSSSIPQSPSASNQVPPAKSCFCFQLVLKWFLTPGEKAAHSDGFLGEKVCFWKLNSTFNRKDPFIPDVCLILRQVQWTLKKKRFTQRILGTR